MYCYEMEHDFSTKKLIKKGKEGVFKHVLKKNLFFRESNMKYKDI